MLSNSVDPYKEDILNEYLKRVLEVNKSINLTSVTDYNKAQLLHLEDSLSVFEDFLQAPEGLYGDIGSGGGFPGVPLGVMSGRETILIDSVKKKMNAVQEILNDLSLTHIQTKGMRIEELSQDYGNSFSVITARALTSLPSLIELTAPLLQMKGQLLALKAHVPKDEIAWARSLEDKTGLKFVNQREYYLSDQETYRSLYTFEKVAEPTVELPRKTGLAQKRPLKA